MLRPCLARALALPLALALVAAAAPARAAEPPPGAGPVAPPPIRPTVPGPKTGPRPIPAPLDLPGAGPRPTVADPAYDEAVDALRAGRWGLGRRLLEKYLEDPDAPRRAEAAALHDLAGAFVAAEAELPPGALDQRGRVELAVFSSVYGLWLGGATGYLLSDTDVRFAERLLLTMTGGGVAGLLASLALTSGTEITEGRAQLISMGGLWGTVNASAIALSPLGLTEKPLVGTVVAGGLLGIAGGALLGDEAPPAGYLSLVNSGGLWAGYATGIALVIAESDLDGEDNWLLMVAGADLGLALTAILAQDVQISQGRVRLIDLGGVLGTLAGAGVLVASESADSGAGVGVPLLLGTGAGIAIAAAATRDWDEPGEDVIRSGLDLRGPAPAMIPGTDGKSVAVGVNLAQGTF